MKAYVFPGQGAQFSGMGLSLIDASDKAKQWFDRADEIMGFELSQIMFYGSEEELRETRVTQPAIFVQSVASAFLAGSQFQPAAVAGHSLGEFSALVAAGAISFEDGLMLVKERALAMQGACDLVPGTMAAILGLPDEVIEEVCAQISEIVIPANYNAPGQLVISGSVAGVEKAVAALIEAGAKRAVLLPVGGAFHSPLMEPARERLAKAITNTHFTQPVCPIYQNVTAMAETDTEYIKNNLIAQLTAPVLWTQSVHQMVQDGMNEFVEVGGKGSVLRGMIRKIEPEASLSAL
jgi:[acyl-carrier-protein] S-malonyltransferase